MCDWYRTADSETSGGNPTLWGTEDGDTFLVAYVRVSGPGDGNIPRRVLGIGCTRASAQASAWDALTRYDPSHTFVSRADTHV